MMNMKTGLWQQQSLKLNMTQQLSQAIALLQYSSQELHEFLQSKELENPLIQLESTYYEESFFSKQAHTDQSSYNWIEQISAPKHSLTEHLLLQLNMKSFTKKQYSLFKYLIECIDENGYLHTDGDYLRKYFSITEEELEFYIDTLQQLEPAGIAARNLKECLYLQVIRDLHAPEISEDVLQHYFDEFVDRKWSVIAKELQVDLAAVQAVYDYVQTLKPRPWASFSIDSPQYVIPEMVVTTNQNQLVVTLFDGTTVDVKINDEYARILDETKDKDIKKYLQDKRKDFDWIVQSLQQRKDTILKVGKQIVEKQQEFFLRGPDALKPLTLRQIADETGLHESTVSRAVRNKYMQTPYGIFELKFFFATGLKTTHASDSEEISTAQIKKALSKIIEEESKKKPMSDQKIADQLKHKGYDISRRTVAKYRDELGIPSSSLRKRYEKE